MAANHRLAAVRALHTAIYVVMAAGTLAILYGGVTGARGAWLCIALTLLAIESLVFAACGLRCPLTGVVARMAGGRRVSDTYFAERLTRHTLTVFGPLLATGFALVVVRLLLDL